MDQDQPRLSKKELKEQKRLLKLQQELEGKKQNTIKWIAISFVSLAFLAFFIFLIVKGKENAQKVDVKISQSDWIKGNKDAKVTLIEFGDFQCPACKKYEPWVRQLSALYPNDLRLVFKHFPLEAIHKNALPAAVAAEAAGKQNKFWEMHDLLYDKQDEWADSSKASEIFTSYAKILKLDVDTFKKDMNDSSLNQKITDQKDEGVQLGVDATPTFFLNNKKIDSPRSYEVFKKLIEDAIKQ